MRIVLTIGVILLVIVVGGVALIYTFRDPLLRIGIEQIASDAAKTQVTIEKIETRLSESLIQVTNLQVANPAGFSEANAVELPVITLKLGPQQSGALTFEEVALVDPILRYELHETGTVNLNTISDNLSAYGGGADGDGGEAYIIDRLDIDRGRIILAVPGGTEQEITLPGFTLTDLGRDDGGLSGTDLSAKVIEALARQAAEQVARSPFSSIVDGLGGLGRRLFGTDQ